MEDFITHTFSISNHPIERLDKPFNIQYVLGIGEFMCYMSNFNNRAKIIFEVWSHSILGYIPEKSWNYSPDWVHIKKALYIKRDGLRFFTMRQSFIFDCFYLIESLDTKLTFNAYRFFFDKVCGFFTKSILNEIYMYFQSNCNINNVLNELREHRYLNMKFQAKPLKKILVVATMGAGKSTLINALVGYRINKVKTTACTNRLCSLYNKPYKDGIIAEIDKQKFVYSDDVESLNSDYFTSAGLHFNSLLSSERICLIDTPGANYSKDKSHGEITKQAISSNNYDMIIFVSNCQSFATNDEANLLEYTITHSFKPIIFVLNQLDRFKTKQDSIKKMVCDFKNLLIERHIASTIVPISAHVALLMKLDEDTLDEEEAFELAEFKLKMTQDYYDLESYVIRKTITMNKTIISRTGIILLEQIIKKTLYEKN